MERIVLHRTPHGYLAEWQERKGEGWKPNQYVMELFGTWTIPTSFTANANAGMVLNEIRRLNPGTLVQFA